MALVTLMACYGGPQDRECPKRVDLDKDGATKCAVSSYPISAVDDCDDADPKRRPGFPDPIGDGIDQNCDGVDGIATPAQRSAMRSSSASPQQSASVGASASAGPVLPSASASSSSAPRSGPPIPEGAGSSGR